MSCTWGVIVDQLPPQEDEDTQHTQRHVGCMALCAGRTPACCSYQLLDQGPKAHGSSHTWGAVIDQVARKRTLMCTRAQERQARVGGVWPGALDDCLQLPHKSQIARRAAPGDPS